MAIPRFSFGSGSSRLYNPNQILVPTTLTSADKTQLLDYDKKIADYKTQVDAYNKAVEEHNKSGKGTFSQKEPTDPGITQEEIDTFGAESAARAQQLQTARQNALNIIQNPEGFSSYYGIGSLGFEEGGEVPVNFVGTGEFPETDPSVGYRRGPASQDKDLPLAAELLADSIPVAGDVKAGIEAADYFNKGEYGNAALSVVGVLPFVPPLAGIVKKYRNRYGDPEAANRRLDEIVEKGRREKAARESTPILDDLTIPESITSYVIAPEKVTRTEFITKLASDPKVLEKSQKALDDLGYGETVPMFRFVRINPARNKELLPESFISATLDPKKIKRNFNYMTDSKWSTGDEYRLLRYDVPREKIKAYLPALTEKINNRVNKKIKQKYIGQDKGALGSQTQVVKNPSRLANELIPMQDEILADVSEINPQIIKTPEGKPQNLLTSDANALTLPVSSGEVSSFDDVLKTFDSYKYNPPSERKLYENAIKEYQKFFSKGFEEGGAVGEGIASLRPAKTTMGLAPYGIRNSGEGAKGLGYFGETTSPSGQAVTEYSLYDEDIGEYPSIVPTLTSEELQDTIRRSSQGQSPSMEVVIKARMYAKDRLSEGKSPFAGPTELRFPVPSQTDDNMLQRIDRYLTGR